MFYYFIEVEIVCLITSFSMSKKLSGAQRRKLNKESESARETLMTKVPKLSKFFLLLQHLQT